MIVISHRRNTAAELRATSNSCGIEVDVRSWGDVLHIHHDAYVMGENFEEWLNSFHHKTLILNVKEEGLEGRLLKLMQERSIDDFFFLDQSFPFLIKTARMGERRCAVRISEFEATETAYSLQGKIEWIWVDCFNPGLWLSGDDAKELQDAGFRLCLVSPELQGRTTADDLALVQEAIASRSIAFDAVCTKVPKQWE